MQGAISQRAGGAFDFRPSPFRWQNSPGKPRIARRGTPAHVFPGIDRILI
jgi:hypothetical protein